MEEAELQRNHQGRKSRGRKNLARKRRNDRLCVTGLGNGSPFQLHGQLPLLDGETAQSEEHVIFVQHRLMGLSDVIIAQAILKILHLKDGDIDTV